MKLCSIFDDILWFNTLGKKEKKKEKEERKRKKKMACQSVDTIRFGG